jgi:hypothetical protein
MNGFGCFYILESPDEGYLTPGSRSDLSGDRPIQRFGVHCGASPGATGDHTPLNSTTRDNRIYRA